MFTDIKTSRDAMQSYKLYLAEAPSTSGAHAEADIELSVQARPRSVPLRFRVTGEGPCQMDRCARVQGLLTQA